MNEEFNRRWKLAAAHAAPPDAPTEMPPGFATRVLAHWRAQTIPSPAALWHFLALRVLGALALVLVLLAALDFTDARGREAWRPDLGDAVSECFWML